VPGVYTTRPARFFYIHRTPGDPQVTIGSPQSSARTQGFYAEHVLDHDSPVALYVQLAEILRGQISRGDLTGRVPSVKSLAQQFEVSAGTAEKALALLRGEGLIRSSIGRGHYVA
jgi:GntR family transcriptional regulator